METIYLNFHGIGVRLESENSNLIENIRRDFSFFSNNGPKADIKIEAIFQIPDFNTIPYSIPFIRTRDALCYESNGIKYINYLDKALSIYNLKDETCRITCNEPHLLHEITYLTILSRIGEKLDLRAIHRVHALGFTYKDNGVLCLSSMSGGKTTLGMGLLNNPYVKLISDDTPLVNKELMLLPFPIRIGINPCDMQDIPSKFCREIIRKRFGRKVLIDIEYFYPKVVSDPVSLRFVFIVKRKNSAIPEIKKANLILFLFSLIHNIVFARGIAQVKEYFIQKDIKDIPKKIKILMLRFITSMKIFWKFNPYIFYLSKDLEKNSAKLTAFL